jgi:hypothetical protein
MAEHSDLGESGCVHLGPIEVYWGHPGRTRCQDRSPSRQWQITAGEASDLLADLTGRGYRIRRNNGSPVDLQMEDPGYPGSLRLDIPDPYLVSLAGEDKPPAELDGPPELNSVAGAAYDAARQGLSGREIELAVNRGLAAGAARRKQRAAEVAMMKVMLSDPRIGRTLQGPGVSAMAKLLVQQASQMADEGQLPTPVDAAAAAQS